MRLDDILRLCIGVHRISVGVFVEIDGLYEKATAARLHAFATARALPEYVMAHEAASRFRDALRAVDKALNLYGRRRTDALHLGKRALAREDNARRALRDEKLHRF